MRKIVAMIFVSITLLFFVGCEETSGYSEHIESTFSDTQSTEALATENETESETETDITETETSVVQTTLTEYTEKQTNVLPLASQTVVTTAVIEEAIEIIRADYILNTNSKVFHYPSCKSVRDMKEKNKEYFYGSREEVIENGYKSCGNCHP